jgi:hypothetical protein
VARELDLIGGLSIGGWLRRHKERHLAAIGTPCSNCETVLQGPYCYNCGQLAEGFERSIWHLGVEAFESFFHFDGRLFQTVPKLALQPGRLTRDYLDGKRAYQIPPLRMFLIVILVLFFAAGVNMGATGKQAVNFNSTPQTAAQQKAADVARAKALQSLKSAGVVVKTLPASKVASSLDDSNINFGVDDDKHPPKGGAWLRDHLKLLKDHQAEFTMLLEERAHWVAIGMLPLAALILGLLFIFQRRFYLFDHLIFTMHSLSFQGLLMSTIFLLDAANFGLGGLLILASPVHLFVHMRGTYKSSIFGTLLRMALLWVFSVIAFSCLFMALIWTSLTALEH